ncbi:MAG: NlpC/P60 family protein [Solirubrobacteraceae bacterium]
MTRWILAGIAGVALLPVLMIAAATSAFQGIGVADPGPTALADIPPGYLQLYLAAATTYAIPWQVLAAVGKVECDHGRNPHPACTVPGAVNPAGAGGPMQFLAATWARYGVDADADGTADRWEAADAIYGAANYLRASGAPQHLEAAIFAYNHSQAYVADVLRWAARYERNAQSQPLAPAAPGGAVARVVSFALSQLGVPYRYGGESPSGFDCSGLVQAAYHTAGIALPRTAQQQFDTGPHLAPGSRLLPGDLVFFGNSTTSVGHVGIVIAPTRMVDAPHAGAVVRTEPFPDRIGDPWGTSSFYLGATRPTAGTTR